MNYVDLLIEKESKISHLFGDQMFDQLSRKEKILYCIRRIECELSPENLNCDGEISRDSANLKYKELMRDRRALVEELGHEPTNHELYPS